LKLREELKTKTLARSRRQNQGKLGLKEADRTEKPSLAPTCADGLIVPLTLKTHTRGLSARRPERVSLRTRQRILDP